MTILTPERRATAVETLHASALVSPKVVWSKNRSSVELGESTRTGYHRAGCSRPIEREKTNVSEPIGDITHEVKRNPWRLGIFYVDSGDPRLIVRNRSGLGWTLNFGRPLAWVILVAIIVIMSPKRRRRES
jgi:hypothetical protein